MFKSYPSAWRFITACAVLVVATCFGGCSTKSQLVGKWSDIQGEGKNPSPDASGSDKWEFSSDNTCRERKGLGSGQCKYAVLDDGRIKIEFQRGAIVMGKLEAGTLVLENGEERTVLYKW